MGRSDHFRVGAAPLEEVDAVGRQYMHEQGLRDPAYGRARDAVIGQDPSRALAGSHERQALMDPKAKPYYDKFAHEINQQYDALTKPRTKGGLGLDVSSHPEDQYGKRSMMDAFGEMKHDVREHGRIRILSTEATGGHPYFSNEQNDRVRAVHEVFGHLGSGRGVDKHGEEAAYQKHASMFSPDARRVATTEFRGQVAYYWKNKEFPQQRMALHPEHMSSPQFAEIGVRGADIDRARASNRKQGIE